MTEPEQQVALPISGRHIQWRPETRQWRIFRSEDADGTNDMMWTPWMAGSEDAVHSDCERGAHEQDAPWWLVYGELAFEEASVTVTLADGTRPTVQRVGPIYAAEWRGAPQIAVVERDGSVLDVDLAGMARRRNSTGR